MARVKKGKIAHARRERLLKYTKGFKWGRKNKERAAKEALLHAWTHSFAGRKNEKRVMRQLWNVKVNAAARLEGMTYSKLIAAMKKKGVKLDRKVLAAIAEHEPEVFKKVIAFVK